MSLVLWEKPASYAKWELYVMLSCINILLLCYLLMHLNDLQIVSLSNCQTSLRYYLQNLVIPRTNGQKMTLGISCKMNFRGFYSFCFLFGSYICREWKLLKIPRDAVYFSVFDVFKYQYKIKHRVALSTCYSLL